MATLTYAAPRSAGRARSTRATRPATRSASVALRLTRRGRVLLVLALMLVAFVAFSSLRVATQAGTAPTGPATATVTVHPGETLWQIARRVAPGDDTRDTVLRIRELNALDTSVVQAGQRLIVPR
jgi:LysM repeat protein